MADDGQRIHSRDSYDFTVWFLKIFFPTRGAFRVVRWKDAHIESHRFLHSFFFIKKYKKIRFTEFTILNFTVFDFDFDPSVLSLG